MHLNTYFNYLYLSFFATVNTIKSILKKLHDIDRGESLSKMI